MFFLHYIKKSKIYLKNDKNKLIPYAQQITKAENILKSLINTVIIENDDYSSTTTFKNIEWSYLSNYTIEAERGVKKLTKNILSVNPDSVNLMISYVAGLLNPFSIYNG